MTGDKGDRDEKGGQGRVQLHFVFPGLEDRLSQVVCPVEDTTLECFDFIKGIGV